MAQVKPFSGIRYNLSVIKDLALVTTPPFDVISDDEKLMYHERHAKNIIRLTLGQRMPGDNAESNWYKRAAAYLEQWLQEGTLVKDEEQAFYLLRRDYVDKRGRERTRYGFTGLVKVEDPERRIILGHELTFDDVIAERLRLIEAARANLCPIFALYSDPGGEVVGMLKSSIRDPLTTISLDDGSKNVLWSVSDAETCHFVSDAMKDRIVFIADGHHRYATARLYRNEMRRKEGKDSGLEPYDYVMMTLVALEDDGLAIYPPHRLVRGLHKFDEEGFLAELEECFDVVPVLQPGPVSERVDALVQLMADSRETTPRFGVLLKDTAPRLLTLKQETNAHPWLSAIQASVWRDLDVPILHRLVLEGMLGIKTSSSSHVQYTPDEQEAVRLVQSEKAQVALLLNPPTPDDIKKVSLAGALMPHKSTYFYPKLLTGLVMNKMY